MERGKPVSLPVYGVSKPQGKPNGVRVWECRKSESRFVMKRIEVETSPHMKVGKLLQGNSLQETFRTF